MTRRQLALLWAACGFAGVAAVLFVSIFRSTSSTAAIGIIFIPFYAAPFAALFFIFGYCLSDIVDWLKGTATELSILMKLRAVVAVILLISGISYLIYGSLLTITVNQVQTLGELEINKFLERSMFRNNKYALGALAQNPNASPRVLDRVALISNPELHHRMWSVWPVMGENGKGLAVMRLIAMHKNVSEAALVNLSKSPDNYVLSAVAANPKTPVSIIRELSDKGDYLAQWGLAANTNAPADILNKLAETGDQYARSSVARNSSTSVETLMRLAKDPVWHVRRDVVSNPHTSTGAIKILGNDPDERVRSLVEYKLDERKRSNR